MRFMTVDRFLKNAESIYHKYFPHSKCKAEFDTYLYRSISIKGYLANKKEECPGEILMNDMFKVLFYIQMDGNMQFHQGVGLDRELPEDLQMEVSSGCYFIKPETIYMEYGVVKIPFRKTHGNSEKMLVTFDKFCEKMRDSVVKDYFDGKIHKEYTELVNAKLIQVM